MKNKKLINILLWILEGILVGVGAILPGVSGGALLVVFGAYRPVIEVLSDFKNGLKKHFFMLFCIGIGGVLGIVLLSKAISSLMSQNEALVTCIFVGFIVGTFPELWSEAGEQGRGQRALSSVAIGFFVMMVILCATTMLTTASGDSTMMKMEPGFLPYILCGVLWALSFIVPGLSSSSFIFYLGLYEPMSDGIGNFDFSVIIPMSIGFLGCMLLLSQLIARLYKKHFTVVSHGVFGIVIAIMILIPCLMGQTLGKIAVYLVLAAVGAVVSFGFTKLCAKFKEKQ